MGKTTVGRSLAEKLSWEFVDLDAWLEAHLKRSIREVVETEGWEAFRRAEREALRAFSGRKEVVLSLGGGAVMHRKEMEALKAGAFVVWLRARPETIIRRLSADPRTETQRPSLTGRPLAEEVGALLEERTPLYRHFADLTLSTDDLSPEEAARRILEEWQARNKMEPNGKN